MKTNKTSLMLAMLLVTLVVFPAAIEKVIASELDLNISSKAINVQFDTQARASTRNSAKFHVGAGYIYREGGTKIGNLDFHALGQTAIQNLPTTVFIGARAIYFDEDAGDGAGLALGGGAQINLPQVPGFSVKGTAHFAPQITSLDDLENLFRTDIRANYRIIQNADLYVGYRLIRAKIEDRGSNSVDENVHLGFTFIF